MLTVLGRTNGVGHARWQRRASLVVAAAGDHRS